MPDLGIGEAIAAIAGGGLGGLGSLFGLGEAVAAPLEAAAIPAAEGAFAGAAGAGAGAGAGALVPFVDYIPVAAGAAMPAAETGTALTIPAAVGAGGGFGAESLGLGAAAGLGLEGAAGGFDAISPSARVGQGFDVVNKGIQTGDIQPTGTMPNTFAAQPSAPLGGGGGSAAATAAPAGVDTSVAGIDTLPSVGPQTTTQTPFASTPTDLAGGGGAGLPTGAKPASFMGDVGNFLNKNPLLTTAVGGLGSMALSPVLSKLMPGPPGSDKLSQLAQQESNVAARDLSLEKQFLDPSLTGKLPAQYETTVQQGVNDAITATKAKYANLGLGGSTMEQQEIDRITSQGVVLRGQIAQQLATTGVAMGGQAATAMGLEGRIYDTLMNATIQQDAALQAAIGNFAGQIGRGAAQGQVGRTGQLINV